MKFMAYITSEIGQISQISGFCLSERVLWQVTQQGHSGWCEVGGNTAQVASEEQSHLEEGILSSGRSSTEHCDLSISMFLHRKHQEGKNGTASGMLICLLVYSMLKWKFKVQ